MVLCLEFGRFTPDSINQARAKDSFVTQIEWHIDLVMSLMLGNNSKFKHKLMSLQLNICRTVIVFVL